MHVGLIGAGNIAPALTQGSPGGTTARGPVALERRGVRPDLQDAVDAVMGAGR